VRPLGNDGPPAVATGMSTIGRSRSTSCLSNGLSTAVPSPVTATYTASRYRRRISSATVSVRGRSRP
jgi:hypothetical protein